MIDVQTVNFLDSRFIDIKSNWIIYEPARPSLIIYQSRLTFLNVSKDHESNNL